MKFDRYIGFCKQQTNYFTASEIFALKDYQERLEASAKYHNSRNYHKLQPTTLVFNDFFEYCMSIGSAHLSSKFMIFKIIYNKLYSVEFVTEKVTETNWNELYQKFPNCSDFVTLYQTYFKSSFLQMVAYCYTKNDHILRAEQHKMIMISYKMSTFYFLVNVSSEKLRFPSSLQQ